MVNGYVLINTYNPAYNYWLRAYLRKKKILGDREYSWKEAQDIVMDMDKRGVHDNFFEKYFSAWTEHEAHAPDYFNLLRMILPIDKKDGGIDLTVIRELDSDAKARGQRVLFTMDDAAKDFYWFYDRFLTKPLAQDLERGADGNRLVRYFEFEEFHEIHKTESPEKEEKVIKEVAQKLLEWLQGITPERILDDIRQTLDRHYGKGLAAASPENGYYHQSKYVHFFAHKSEGADKPAKAFLRPARMYGVIKQGYDGVYYPTYYVLAES